MSRKLAPNTYQDARSIEINRECVEHKRLLGTVTIANAAKQQGAILEWFTTRDLWATLNGRRVAITGHHGVESALASGIEGDKLLAQELMAARGISVPAGRRVYSAEEAVQAQQEIGHPIVIKPITGSMGRGVTVNVASPEDIRAGFSRAAASGARVLVEQYIEGTAEYRAHATPTECVGVFRRLLPGITGDGYSTVEELIERKNELRLYNPSTRPNPIPMDDVAEGFLQRRGLTWDSVVPEGDHIVVRDVNGITSGGDSDECWDSVSDSIKHAAVGAVAAIPGMGWGGVDILVEESTGIPYVIEVNTNAAINGSTFPVYGTPRDLGRVIWNQLYSQSSSEPTESPNSSKLLDAPTSFSSFHGASDVLNITLRGLLMNELQAQGRWIHHHNERIWSAQITGQPTLWFNSTLSQSDLATAIHPIRRLILLRRILRTVAVPRAAGRRINHHAQLEAFRKKVGTSVAVLPLRKALGRATSKIIESEDEIDESILVGKNNWFVQARHPGLRFSIIATPYAALAVVSPSGQMKPDDGMLEHISTLAVSAVRAVPQLRWAVVDIVHLSPDQKHDSRPAAVVEELSLNPTFDVTSEVIAGSMKEVIDIIVAGAESSTFESPHASHSVP